MRPTRGAQDVPTYARSRLARRGDSVRRPGLFPLPTVSLQLAPDIVAQAPPKDRWRFRDDVKEAVWALNNMHGDATRGSTVAFTCDDAAAKANLLHEETQ